jgi:hypothetical protein
VKIEIEEMGINKTDVAQNEKEKTTTTMDPKSMMEIQVNIDPTQGKLMDSHLTTITIPVQALGVQVVDVETHKEIVTMILDHHLTSVVILVKILKASTTTFPFPESFRIQVNSELPTQITDQSSQVAIIIMILALVLKLDMKTTSRNISQMHLVQRPQGPQLPHLIVLVLRHLVLVQAPQGHPLETISPITITEIEILPLSVNTLNNHTM